jgi:hypothetical protein
MAKNKMLDIECRFYCFVNVEGFLLERFILSRRYKALTIQNINTPDKRVPSVVICLPLFWGVVVYAEVESTHVNNRKLRRGRVNNPMRNWLKRKVGVSLFGGIGL